MQERIISLFTVILIMATGLQAQTTYFASSFEQGMPETFQNWDIDENQPSTDMANLGFAVGIAWIVTNEGDDNNHVACSTSCYKKAGTSNDWLVLPAIEVKDAETKIIWRARTQDKDYRDGYKLYIGHFPDESTGRDYIMPDDFQTEPLFSSAKENYDWTLHEISLADYVGQTIYLAFVNDSKDKACLYIDDIFVGVPATVGLSLDFKRCYDGYGDIPVSGKAYANLSQPVHGYTIGIEMNGKTIEQTFGGTLEPGVQVPFTLDDKLYLEKNATADYRAWIKAGDDQGEISGRLSAYQWKVVAEEITGTWDQYSVRGIGAMNYMRENNPDGFIGIAVHADVSNIPDSMAIPGHEYLNWLMSAYNMNGYPYCVINRNAQYSVDPSNIPTTAANIKKNGQNFYGLAINASYDSETNLITGNTSVAFAKDFENANFKLAYIVIENDVHRTHAETGILNNYCGYDQINGYAGGGLGECYGFESKPSSINADDIWYQDVARGYDGNDGYKGIEGIIPNNISDGDIVMHQMQLSMPSTVLKKENTELIVLLLDNSGSILNAEKCNIEMKLQQTLGLDALPEMTYGDEPYQLPIQTEQGLPLQWEIIGDKDVVHFANDEKCVIEIGETGTVSLSATQIGNVDFEPFFKEFQLTVNKAPLVITAMNYTRYYGEENPEFSAQYESFVYGEDESVLKTKPTLSTTATISSPVGKYPITASGAEAANYNINYIDGILTITVDSTFMTQSMTLTTLPTMTYGDEAYDLPTKTIQGLPLTWTVSDEKVAEISNGKLIVKNSGATSVTATQEGDGHFNPFIKEFTLVVNKANLTITANDCERMYGLDNPELTVHYDGFVNGEDESVLTTKPTVSTTATSSSPAGKYPIIVSGAEAANYNINYIDGILTITVDPTFMIDGIVYDITSEEEQTVQVGDNKGFSGDAVIPESVQHGGKLYAVTTISNEAFSDCSGLTSVTIPASVTSIGNGAFLNCNDLKIKVIVTDRSAFLKNRIPYELLWALNSFFDYYWAHYNGIAYDIVLIDENGEEIKDFVIPDDITNIDSYALFRCTGLTSVSIHANVTSIGEWAFEECGLSTVKLFINDEITLLNNNTVSKIKDSFFDSENEVMDPDYTTCPPIVLINEDGEEIEDFVIPDGVTSIDDYALYRCRLTSVTIPSSVTSIGHWAFFRGGPKTVKLSINDKSAFVNNQMAYKIACETGNSTYYGVYGSLHYLPNGFKIVLFEENGEEIKDFVIPDDITSIDKAFNYCGGLTSVTISNSVTSIGSSAFEGCSGLTSVTIPNSVTSISDNAFTGCDNLNSVVLHCPSIGNCFQGLSSIQEVFLGEEVSSISGSAFNGCSGLTSVTSKIVSPFAIQSGAFGGVSPECILTVPKGMVNEYIAKGWNMFGGGIFDESIRCIDGIYYALDSGKKTATVTNQYGYDGDSDYSWLKASYADTLDIPDVVTYDGEQYSVTAIGKNAMRKCNELAAVCLPDGLTDAATLKDLQAKIYVNRGTTTLLALWTIGMEPYEKNTDYVLTAPKFDIVTTQTTATLKATPVYPEYTYAYNDMIPLGEEGIRWTGLYPEYSEEVTLNVMLGTQCYESKQTFTTQSLAPKVIASQRTASSITFKGIYTEGDADVDDEYTLTVDGENILGDTKTLTGLEPNTGYTAYFTVRVHYGDNGQYTKSYTGTSTLQTEPISFTTMPAKIITADDVIVSSAVNLNDAETTAGFEWRVAGGDEDLFESKYGQAYLYEGMMEGTIHKLNPNYLWKFRPYYQSANGYYYYGNWKGIDLSDNQSYFEPTVHTYAGVEMGDGTATVSGYAQRGSDEIAEEGFEYWEESGNTSDAPLHAPAYASIPDNAMKVLADGTLMQAQLTGLTPNSTYSYVAFVRTTKGKTYYGVVRQFTTGEHQQATSVEAINAKQAPTNEAIYDLLGRKHDNLHKGVNIIRMEDGSIRKVYVK